MDEADPVVLLVSLHLVRPRLLEVGERSPALSGRRDELSWIVTDHTWHKCLPWGSRGEGPRARGGAEGSRLHRSRAPGYCVPHATQMGSSASEVSASSAWEGICRSSPG